MKMLRFYICLILMATASPVATTAATSAARSNSTAPTIALDFSICLGRASAALEYAHLIGHPPAREMVRWQSFNDLYQAVAPDTSKTTSKDIARQLLSQRIRAKMALSRLLTLGRFNDDPRLSAKARADATLQLRQCDELIS